MGNSNSSDDLAPQVSSHQQSTSNTVSDSATHLYKAMSPCGMDTDTIAVNTTRKRHSTGEAKESMSVKLKFTKQALKAVLKETIATKAVPISFGEINSEADSYMRAAAIRAAQIRQEEVRRRLFNKNVQELAYAQGEVAKARADAAKTKETVCQDASQAKDEIAKLKDECQAAQQRANTAQAAAQSVEDKAKRLKDELKQSMGAVDDAQSEKQKLRLELDQTKKTLAEKLEKLANVQKVMNA